MAIVTAVSVLPKASPEATRKIEPIVKGALRFELLPINTASRGLSTDSVARPRYFNSRYSLGLLSGKYSHKGGKRGDAGGCQKGGLASEATRYNPCGCGAHRRSDAGAGADRSMCEIEPTGPCDEICDC